MGRDGFDLYSNFIYLGSVAIGLCVCLAFRYGCFRLAQGSYRGIRCALTALPFAAALGLRAYHVGYDTYAYAYHMYGNLTISSSGREYTFSTMVRLLHWLTDGRNYTVMLLFFSFAILYAAFYAADRIGGNSNLAVFYTAYCLISGLCITDQFRQLFGCSLFLLALAMYYSKQKAAFIIMVFLAVGVHNTAAIAFAVYLACCFVVQENERRLGIWTASGHNLVFAYSFRLALFLSLVVVGTWLFYTSSDFIDFVAQVMPKAYVNYITARLDYKQIGFGLLLDSMIVVPGIFLNRYAQTKQEKSMLLFGLLVPAFRVCGYVSYFLYRMLYYPQIVLLAFYGAVLAKEKVPGYWKWAVCLISALFYVVNYMYMNNHGAFPYRFYFEAPPLMK